MYTTLLQQLILVVYSTNVHKGLSRILSTKDNITYCLFRFVFFAEQRCRKLLLLYCNIFGISTPIFLRKILETFSKGRPEYFLKVFF